MKRLEDSDNLGEARGSVVSLGTFDGLHRGHQAVIKLLREEATRSGARAGVITFVHPPRRRIASASGTLPAPPASPVLFSPLITSPEHRLVLLERLGVDWTWVVVFSRTWADMEPRRFAEEVLVERLGVRGVVMGFDNHFGRGGEGTTSMMRALGEELGFFVSVADGVDYHGKKVSSTRIREAIPAGDLVSAKEMLGRYVSLYGEIVAGDGRGRRLGFPTANLDADCELCPPPGVYAALADIPGGKRYPAVANIGFRPTFHADASGGAGVPISNGHTAETPVVEIHLMGFSGNLYGRKMEISIVEKIRDEKRFADEVALAERISEDIEAARVIIEREVAKTR